MSTAILWISAYLPVLIFFVAGALLWAGLAAAVRWIRARRPGRRAQGRTVRQILAQRQQRSQTMSRGRWR